MQDRWIEKTEKDEERKQTKKKIVHFQSVASSFLQHAGRVSLQIFWTVSVISTSWQWGAQAVTNVKEILTLPEVFACEALY